MSPTIGRPIDASLGGRVLEDARKISRPAELGFVVLGIILPGRAPN